MWVIYGGCHLSRTHENHHAPAEDRTRDLSINSRVHYHVAIKAGLYRKAVQVYGIPILYPVAYHKLKCLANVFITLNRNIIFV